MQRTPWSCKPGSIANGRCVASASSSPCAWLTLHPIKRDEVRALSIKCKPGRVSGSREQNATVVHYMLLSTRQKRGTMNQVAVPACGGELSQGRALSSPPSGGGPGGAACWCEAAPLAPALPPPCPPPPLCLPLPPLLLPSSTDCSCPPRMKPLERGADAPPLPLRAPPLNARSGGGADRASPPGRGRSM